MDLATSAVQALRGSDGRQRQTLAATAVAVALASAAGLAWALAHHRRARARQLAKDEEEKLRALGGSLDRPASKWEAMFVGAHSRGLMHTVSPVLIGGGSPLSEEVVRSALACLQARHPILRMCYTTESNGALWLREQPDRRVDLMVHNQGLSWEELVDNLTNSVHFPWPTANAPCPIMKVVLCHSPDPLRAPLTVVVFILHHSQFDGTARFRLVRQFMTYVGQGGGEPRGLEEVPMVCQADIEARRAASWHGTPFSRALSVGKMLVRGIRMRALWRFPLHEAPQVLDPERGNWRSALLPVTLERSEVAALAKKCKANGTTVHGALSAAAVLALVDTAEKLGYGGPLGGGQTAGMSHLVSWWESLDPPLPGSSLYSIIGLYNITATLKPEVDRCGWGFAKETMLELRDALAVPGAWRTRLIAARLVLEKLIGLDPNYAATNRTQIPQVAVSNMGRQEFKESYGGFSVEGVYVSSPTASGNGALVTLFAATVNGKMHLSVVVNDNAMSPTTSAMFRDALKDRLIRMTSEQH